MIMTDFCRAMLCKRALCCHAVSIRLFVRLSVVFVNSVNLFHSQVAKPF